MAGVRLLRPYDQIDPGSDQPDPLQGDECGQRERHRIATRGLTCTFGYRAGAGGGRHVTGV